MDYELVSGEPEKHDIVKLTFKDLNNRDVQNGMDTWLRKVVIKINEDILE
jgi:hypothetical protein